MHIYSLVIANNFIKNKDLPDSLGPDGLVQSGVDSDIFSSHHFGGEFFDLFYCTRCTLLEAPVKIIFHKIALYKLYI